MGSLVNRCWATGFSLLRRIIHLKSNRICGDIKLGSRMMSTAVDSTPSSRIMSPPWLMLPPVIEESGDMVYKFYNLSEDKEESFLRNSEQEMADNDAKFVGSSHGWLALYNQRNNNHLFLYNPITRRHIKLPPIETLHEPRFNFTPDGRGRISKLILSSSPDDEDCIAVMTYGPREGLAFCHPCCSTKWTPVVESNLSQSFEKISRSYLSCGYENNFVDSEVLSYGKAYEDFVYCTKSKLFTCIMQFEISLLSCRPFYPTCKWEDWDLTDPHSPVLSSFSNAKHLSFGYDGDDDWINKYLALLSRCRQIPYLVFVEEHDQLFIVIRFVVGRVSPDGSYVHVGQIPYDPISRRLLVDTYPYKTMGFCVLKVNYHQVKGRRMIYGVKLIKGSDTLDGLTMFVGMNHSFAVSSADFPNLKPNSIYFTDANKHDNSIYGGHDIGIFDYANKTLSDCYCYPCVDISSFKRIVPPPMWFTPSSY
ncbi:hypothetical protein CASFOL_001364 [Castilleja foliolosa]|uniref:KIB1-4 beta-propeller domain-containing protein n=1 Tax=Castilleja foliolosa TaxID=1961234 RepID=A0ABD3EML9_9LAMI